MCKKSWGRKAEGQERKAVAEDRDKEDRDKEGHKPPDAVTRASRCAPLRGDSRCTLPLIYSLLGLLRVKGPGYLRGLKKTM